MLTIGEEAVLDGDQYRCRGEQSGNAPSQYSNSVVLTVLGLPTATLTVEPEKALFTGESVTLKCEIQSYSNWRYQWYKLNEERGWTAVYQSEYHAVNRDTLTIRGGAVINGDQYQCRGERRDRPSSSQYSHPLTLTVKGKSNPGASFSVFSLLSSVMAVSPYLLVSIVLLKEVRISPQPPEEVEPLMCLPDQTGSVVAPGEVVAQVNTQVPVVGDHFHRRPSDMQGEVGMSAPSEVHNHLLHLLYVDAEVVLSAPALQVFYLLPVARLITVCDASDHCRVIRKLHNMTAWVDGKFHFLDTWITPENPTTPAALFSAFNFSHSPRQTGRGGGTVSSPTNLHIIVIYRPPCPLCNFKLDSLLSLFPVDGSPLLLLCHVTQAFKTTRVVPILKRPLLDSLDISSYRPNQLQDINQSGFKPAHSTETALITVTERLHAARSAKLSPVLILLDLSTAFDTVNHKILLSVLTDRGITGTAWRWFESYLEDCHYQVCNHISACLTGISSWMTAHHLKINPSKTELLFIPSTTGPHCDLAISFGNSLITPTEDARSLGVILDGQLSFSAHIANLTRSYRFLLYDIRRIQPFLSQDATQLLVQSLVISRLDYCNSLLAGLPLRAIRPLQLIQNTAA
ncbi:hypothetical protein NFI96_027986 [Prochilodus magdalenae]|nr:hypothetical protein NFI96_027986 [Prochilodus magdalenae]